MTAPGYLGMMRNPLAGALGMLRMRQAPVVETVASIIIVNYNGGNDLRRCLESLQICGMDGAEVIVVDNCSSDDSVDCLEENFPGVRLIRSAINLGFGAGNNLGAAIAQGRVLVFLNPDTTVAPGWLEPLVCALEQDPGVGIVTSQILLMDQPERINTCGNNVHLSGLGLCRGMGKVRGLSFGQEVGAVSGAAFAMRRELFERLDGFDESFFLYVEDTDLSLRVRLAGYRCQYVEQSVVYHDYTLAFGPMKVYYQERNRYLMLLKTLRWPTLMVLLPALLLTELVTWGFVLLRDRANLKNKLFAYAWLLFWWREVMEKRRRVQQTRGSRDRDLLKAMTSGLEYSQVGGGLAVTVAHWVFNPLFFVMRSAALAMVWW